MHRDPSFSMAETIQRLEAEVRELQSLGGKRRERRLVLTTVVSMIIATHAVIACVAIKVQADRSERDVTKRLGGRTNDLVTCAHMLDARTRQIDACRTSCVELEESLDPVH
jgi:hypothetical protein